MRLEKIRFYNINSLKGEHTISFDEGVLSDAGLFAITGATGAGKSTILDVITLALYNYVPRLGKISKTNIEKMGSIITHFTEEAWAEVEYTAHGNRYMSKWSISKTRNGTFRDYQMDLVLLPQGESVGLKKGEIPAKNTEIIGLTSDQFLKSILLSQGEFSTFLKANKDERAKLLEEITGTHIYRDLGRLAFEKTKDKKEKVETLRAQMNMILLLTEEEKQKITQELTEVKGLATTTQLDLSRNNDIQLLLNLRSQIENRKNEIAEKKVTHTDTQRQAEADLIILTTHKEAKDFEDVIDLYEDARKTVLRLAEEITTHRNNRKRNAQIKKSLIEQLSSTIHSPVDESTFYDRMSVFEKEVTDLDSRLKTLKDQGTMIRERIQNLCKKHQFQSAAHLGAKIAAKEAIAIIDSRSNEIAVDKEQNREDLQQKWTNLQARKTTLIQYVNQFEKAENYRIVLKDINQKIKSDKEAFQKDKHQWTLKKKEQVAISNAFEMKKKAFEEAKKQAPLKSERELLEDGKPCPLCGAEHHPFAHLKELAEVGQLSLEVDHLEKQGTSIQSELIQLQSNYIQSEKSVESQIDRLEIETINFNRAEKERLIYTENHTWILNIEDNTWSVEIEKYEQESEKIKKQLQHISESHFLRDVREGFIEMIAAIQEFKEAQIKRTEKFSGSSVTTLMNELQNKFTSAKQSIEQDSEMIFTKSEKITLLEKDLSGLEGKLEPLRSKYELEHVKDCKSLLLPNHELNRISAVVENLNKQTVEIKTLTAENEKFAIEFQSNLAKLEAQDELDLSTVSSEILQNQLTEIKLKLAEYNRVEGALQNKLSTNENEVLRFESFQSEMLKLQGENKTWILLSDLIGDAKGKKFSNYAQDLTLIHLLTRANARLASLSDRYSLSFRPEEDDLIVIDQYQGDTERAVKTLSGGETFLISLALALSLSDFASQKVRLESLFIDEGFGTLDQETLDVAMGTLEKLQHDSGKRIGIISHVESLKERINTQILVRKDSQGYSTLEVSVL